jgi:hypothetical protein
MQDYVLVIGVDSIIVLARALVRQAVVNNKGC